MSHTTCATHTARQSATSVTGADTRRNGQSPTRPTLRWTVTTEGRTATWSV